MIARTHRANFCPSRAEVLAEQILDHKWPSMINFNRGCDQEGFGKIFGSIPSLLVVLGCPREPTRSTDSLGARVSPLDQQIPPRSWTIMWIRWAAPSTDSTEELGNYVDTWVRSIDRFHRGVGNYVGAWGRSIDRFHRRVWQTHGHLSLIHI